MFTLWTRDLPEGLHRQLKVCAAKHRRSMTKEVIILLEEALADHTLVQSELPRPFVGAFVLTDEWLEHAKSEGRA